jgi:histidinol-phosphate phosphatase family protein
MSADCPTIDVVVPTVGRDSLSRLLAALAGQAGSVPGRLILVDDRAGAGPAATRNEGWRVSDADWVAFLDDDVEPPPDWADALRADVIAAGSRVAGIQGRIYVPLPGDRRPTDWERNVAGLEAARWATADMVFRRSALADIGGFDERFPRAYREDADLALRLMDAGWALTRGTRRVTHPVGPAGAFDSVHLQRGNADDALMDHLHGPGWRERAGAPQGRRRRHLASAAAGVLAVAAGMAGRRRTAALAATASLLGIAELAWARIAPGPRTRGEVARMVATSAAMPFAATGWWLYGLARAPRIAARPAPPRGPRPDAVLFDRDGTLVRDVPYNGDPAQVELMPGAREAVDRLRRAGVKLGIVSNQSGVARGLLTREQVDAVNRRVEELLGPIGPWLVCEHGDADGCDCRKPEPGLVLRAAEALAVEPARCAVIGDIGADVEAAQAAGARAILVPNGRTRLDEIATAPERAPDLGAAVDALLGVVR